MEPIPVPAGTWLMMGDSDSRPSLPPLRTARIDPNAGDTAHLPSAGGRAPLEERRPIPTIRVVAGRDMLQFSTISPNSRIVLGRDDQSELQLTDITVSKRHAEVISDATGTVTVIDLNSTNGTAVNGRPIRRAVMRPGDSLEVGGVSLRLDLLTPDELTHLDRIVRRLQAANRDTLTGLLTRAYINDELPHLADRCERAGVPFTCAFVDVDRFKSVNDHYGHQVGDEVLGIVSRILMMRVRDSDPSVRFGGEEIVLFLPGSDESTGADVAERSREAIADHDWSRTAPGLQVTASFGISERQPGESLKEWLRRADMAMYHAKQTGRNRVVFASTIDR